MAVPAGRRTKIGMARITRRWRVSKRGGRRGHAAVELALIGPWIFFLFVGVLDFGFYSYALIAVQNAARVAALTAGTDAGAAIDQPRACRLAVDELLKMPNLKAVDPATYSCNAMPLRVEVNSNPNYVDSEGNPATWVRVTYETIQMIPIPGIVTGHTGIVTWIAVG